MLTNDQRKAVALLTADYNGPDWEDYVDDIVATREPASNFTALAAKVETDADYGLGYILTGVQRQKGETRTTIYMIDFGEVRGLYEI